jgi:hypothetical protein
VGTLFLVLIVVAAATAFSIFVATYQAQLEKEQSYTHNRNLEMLGVLHVTPWANYDGSGDWAYLNFTIASLWIDQSVITGIDINDNPVANYSAFGLNLMTGQAQQYTVGFGGQFFVGPDEQFNVNISAIPGMTAGGINSGFYNTQLHLPSTTYLKIDLYTAYDNDFDRAFIPPTAVPIVDALQVFSSGTFVTLPLLDGSQSIQPGNSTIISWSWVVTSANPTITAQGEKVVPPGIAPSSPAVPYSATLTVTNNDGLEGTASVTFDY